MYFASIKDTQADVAFVLQTERLVTQWPINTIHWNTFKLKSDGKRI